VASFLMAPVNRELERMSRLPPPFRRHSPDGFAPGRHAAGRFPRPPGDGHGGPRGPRPPRGDTFWPRHFDLNGLPLNPADTRTLWDPAALADARQGRERRARIVTNGEPLLVQSVPVIEKGEIIGVAQVAYPLAEVEQARAGLDAALLTLIPLGLLGAGAAGSFLTDRVLKRVRGATRAAEQISARDFSARLPVSGNDEFSELADTFNNLLGRLETAFQQQERALEQQRRFTADASHELKTPLTVIKGTASMALAGDGTDARARRSFQDIDRAADAMGHLVQDLLLLARSDGGQLGKKTDQSAPARSPRTGRRGRSR
jgi:signal transduction histidine kinase